VPETRISNCGVAQTEMANRLKRQDRIGDVQVGFFAGSCDGEKFACSIDRLVLNLPELKE
jgi:hypothetical protein